MQQRKDEILAKKARLAELKRQRELRRDELSKGRQSISDASEARMPYLLFVTENNGNRSELDSLISSLVGEGRTDSARSRESGAGLTATRQSRPSSVLSGEGHGTEASGVTGPSTGANVTVQSDLPASTTGTTHQTLSTAPPVTVYDFAPEPIRDLTTYSKGVQTTEPWSPSRWHRAEDGLDGSDAELSPSSLRTARSIKRLSRREREVDEELRANIRREIEEELEAVRNPASEGQTNAPSQHLGSQQNFPSRALTDEELKAVTSSSEFLDFVDRSTKVIERALDEEYDVLADYAFGGVNGADDEDEVYDGVHRKRKSRLREVSQFWDERWSKRRMITALDFSPKFPELLLSSHTKNLAAPHDPDGIVQVWNLHLHDRPEYVFHAQSDVLVAKFSPYHPSLILGGTYSGQVLLWDTRAKSAPIQKTPLTGSGHTHPVYALEMVGTQNANNIISCSTDGVVCSWTMDMLAQPQEILELSMPPPAKTDDLAPTCMACPRADSTYFLVGTEEGGIYSCHRYDRAGAKAGVDPRVSYRGHAAPVMSLQYHPARGPIDLGDLVLSSSLDWSVKLWRVRATAPMSAAGATGAPQIISPLLDLTREDVVYDAAWSPAKPGVFCLVDGAGQLEVWDITVDTEVPVAKAQPSVRPGSSFAAQSLNKVTWEGHDGKRVAVGGLAGVVTVFDVGSELGGAEAARAEEWTSVKKMVARSEGNLAGAGLQDHAVRR